jgi:hypothetical protein
MVFNATFPSYKKWPSWSWSYISWIYNYLCNQVPITTNVVSSNPTHREVYLISPFSSTNKTDVVLFSWKKAYRENKTPANISRLTVVHSSTLL